MGKGAVTAMQGRLRKLVRGECERAQNAQEAGQVAVIVPDAGCPRLLAVIRGVGYRLVLIIVVAEVMSGLVLLMPAIVGHHSPGYLEWQQA